MSPFRVPNAADAAYTSQASIDSGDLAIAVSAGQRAGVVGGCLVTAQATPNMTVIAQDGVVRFPDGTQQFAPYTASLTVTTANGTNPRHDLVVAVKGADVATYAVIPGTPAAVTSTTEPVFPAIPANRIVVCSVYVPAAVTAITSAMLTDKRAIVPNGWYDGTVLRTPWLWPFTPDSPWNLPLATTATFQRANDPATLSFDAASTPAGTIIPWIGYQGYDLPITKATWTDPLATMTDTGSSLRSDVFRIPSNAPIATGTDGSMGVVSPDGRFEHECWQAHKTSDTVYSCVKHVKSDLMGRGIGPGQGIHACGASLAGGLIRAWEIFGGPEGYGELRHALSIGLDGSQLYYAGGGYGIDAFNRGTLTSGYVWPATEQDYDCATAYSGSCPMGSLAAIPPWVDITTLGLSGPGLVIARCLQNYGCYSVDRTSLTWGFAADNPVGAYHMNEWLQPALNDLNTIRAQCRVVTNSTRLTPGGGIWTGDARNRMTSVAPSLPPYPVARPT